MVKTAAEIIELFSTIPYNSEVIIVWYEKEDAEIHLDREITDAEFRKIGNKYNDDNCDEELVFAIERAGLFK